MCNIVVSSEIGIRTLTQSRKDAKEEIITNLVHLPVGEACPFGAKIAVNITSEVTKLFPFKTCYHQKQRKNSNVGYAAVI
jgi:hypothetical protein